MARPKKSAQVESTLPTQAEATATLSQPVTETTTEVKEEIPAREYEVSDNTPVATESFSTNMGGTVITTNPPQYISDTSSQAVEVGEAKIKPTVAVAKHALPNWNLPIGTSLVGGGEYIDFSGRKTLRDVNGLLKNVKYVFDESGLIDWKKMLDKKFFAVKNDKIDQVKRQYGVKDLSELDLSTVDDYYLYIKLGGMNQLANLRGYKSLVQHMDYVSDNKAVATCTMEFIPNFESDFAPFTCSGVANASLHNVSGAFKYYLETMAENRAFSRCIRRALRINIVTEDELSLEKVAEKDDAAKTEIHENSAAAEPTKNGFAQQDALKVFCDEKKIAFEDIKATSIAYKKDLKSEPEKWTGYDSIPALDCYWLLSKLSKKLGK